MAQKSQRSTYERYLFFGMTVCRVPPILFARDTNKQSTALLPSTGRRFPLKELHLCAPCVSINLVNLLLLFIQKPFLILSHVQNGSDGLLMPSKGVNVIMNEL